MATFNAQNIFGLATQMTTGGVDVRRQINSYFGLHGVEKIDGGASVRVTECQGVLYGTGPDGLDLSLALFRSYVDGRIYTLVDNFGRAWPDVECVEFRPIAPVMSNGLVFFQRYTASFLHLTP